jgi:hypothetical protein
MNLEKGLIQNHWCLLWLLFRKKLRLADLFIYFYYYYNDDDDDDVVRLKNHVSCQMTCVTLTLQNEDVFGI